MTAPRMTLVEASLSDLAAALSEGRTTSVALVAQCLHRIAAYDRSGPRLNAVPVLNLQAFKDAHASDLRRQQGETLGPLDGIPYTAKDSYKAKGLTVAAGSPAFANLVATDDAFAIARLRAAGAILIGLTNMPPMANGGMQRGLYGRAESPYNADYLTAAFASGSSNGSGTATAASFAAFGLGEETWSSGRAPAALNALCAYTPSRGIISTRGNWPLVPTMDVVVPHTRCMADLLLLLDTLVADDPDTRGDLWRAQPWVRLPNPSQHRAPSYPALAATASLRGKRIAIPRMYVNADPGAGGPGIGGPSGQPIDTRPSILALWDKARQAMVQAGATIIATDFPVITNYESDRPGAPSIATRGLVPSAFLSEEITTLSAWAWDDFLRANGGTPTSLADADGTRINPPDPAALSDRYTGFPDPIPDYPRLAQAMPRDLTDIPHLEAGLRGLEATRQQDLEDWMDRLGLDAVVFPALADVAPANSDTNPASADIAWRNGTWVANGNLAIRHLGIPTVTVPMGTMADTGMPMGLTFAGRAYDDAVLLQLAAAFEATGPYRTAPPRTPDLPLPPVTRPAAAPSPALMARLAPAADGSLALTLSSDTPMIWAGVDDQTLQGLPATKATLILPTNTHRHSPWVPAYGPLVVVLFADGQGTMIDLSSAT